MIINFLVAWVVNALALKLAGVIVPGVEVKGYKGALLGALALGFVSLIIAPVVTFLSLPLTILTLGLFYLVIMGGLFGLAAGVGDGFRVFLQHAGGALVEALALFGGHDAGGAAFQQPHVQVFFQRGDDRAQGGLAQRLFTGDGRQGA